ncbi:hypothetical protein BV898_13377 [Hypsibius exemplaris]|uniref:G-protein coupled receptors family 1 profile domain-containing protein n=1 Tax=Hypsibius exemplaris TaxID=2072580 RepID=A0A1W0WAW3_HYPEX|nr:hypothetical protein BV898_13377 [Hypsibius exemplaris]
MTNFSFSSENSSRVWYKLLDNSSDLFNASSTTGSLNGWFILSISISVGGATLLLLLIASSLVHEKLHKGSRVLVIHLMTMQLLICGIFYPILNISSYLAMRHIKVNLNCTLLLFLEIATMHAEKWASLGLAVNRFVSLICPRSYRLFTSKKVLIITVTLPWLIGLGDTLPVLFQIGGEFGTSAPFGLCVLYAAVRNGTYGIVWTTIGVYLPICLTGVLYLTLFARLSRRARVGPEERKPSGRARAKQTRQIALSKLLVASFVWYSICYLPGPIVLTQFAAFYVRDVMLWLRTLTLLGYAVSPVIFLCLSQEYRVGVRRLVSPMWCATAFHSANSIRGGSRARKQLQHSVRSPSAWKLDLIP